MRNYGFNYLSFGRTRCASIGMKGTYRASTLVKLSGVDLEIINRAFSIPVVVVWPSIGVSALISPQAIPNAQARLRTEHWKPGLPTKWARRERDGQEIDAGKKPSSGPILSWLRSTMLLSDLVGCSPKQLIPNQIKYPTTSMRNPSTNCCVRFELLL